MGHRLGLHRGVERDTFELTLADGSTCHGNRHRPGQKRFELVSVHPNCRFANYTEIEVSSLLLRSMATLVRMSPASAARLMISTQSGQIGSNCQSRNTRRGLRGRAS